MNNENIEQDKALPSEDTTTLQSLLKNRRQLSNEIEDKKIVLKELMKYAEEVDTLHLPEAMAELGLESFETSDGIKVSVKSFVKASIPTATSIAREKDQYRREQLIEKREMALASLTLGGGGSLIKSKLDVQFEKGDIERKDSAIRELQSLGLNVEVNDTVHTGQLTAWVKEQMSQGTDVDLDAFNVYTGSIAELKMGRKKL
tara:strand:- start:144 stop:749 length:606 start_codon:yes stop_codon:yes gene_type:complete